MFEWPCLIVLGSSAHVQQVPVHAGDPEPGESTIHPPNTRSPNSPNCPSSCADRLFQGPMKNVSEIKFQRFQPTSEVACERTSQHCSWNLSWAEMFQLRHEAEVNLHQITSRHINMNNSTDVRLIQLSPHLWKSTLRRPAASAWYQGRSSSPKAKRQSDTFRYRVESFIRKLYKSWFFFVMFMLQDWNYLKSCSCQRVYNFQIFNPFQLLKSGIRPTTEICNRSRECTLERVGTVSRVTGDHFWPTLVLHRPPKEDKLFRSSASNMKPCTQKTWCEWILFIPPIVWVFWQKGTSFLAFTNLCILCVWSQNTLWHYERWSSVRLCTMQQLHFWSRPER